MNTCFQRCTIYVIFALILTLLIPITYGEAESSQTEPVKLKVLLLPFLSFAPFFIAEEEGYFAEQGLEVEFVKMGSGAKAIPPLLKGDLDVAAGTVGIGVLNAISRGGLIKIVADKGSLDPTWCTYNGLLARTELIETGQLENASQLKGKRLAVETMTPEGYYLEKLFRSVDLTFDDVTTEDLPPSVMSEALETGAVDLVHVGEPWLTRLRRMEKAVLWLPAHEIIPHFQWAVILYGPNLLTANPEHGRRFMAAYVKAIRQYNQGKTERNMEILTKHTRLDRQLLEEACWPAIRNDGSINVNSVLDFQNWGIEKGLLDSKVTEEQFWDNRFIEHANQLLGIPKK